MQNIFIAMKECQADILVAVPEPAPLALMALGLAAALVAARKRA